MKQLTAFLSSLVFFYTASANTFTVTSNADSGPGTLREAITLANGNGISTNDTIAFAIANVAEAGRTISLRAELPPLSANITIDGTTQPGTMLGISNAKVVLYLDHYTPSPFVFLFINGAINVKIYGLCFKFFDNPDAGGGGNYAIYLRNSSNITVGAPGKGNLFSAVRAGVTNNFWNYYTDSIRGLTVQSNVFGLNSINWPVRRGYIELIRASEIIIGGPTAAEGNIFVGASINVSQVGSTGAPFFVRVQNNKFNLNWNGSQYFQEGGSLTLYGRMEDDTLQTKTFILDNIFSGGWPGGISLTQLYHKAILKGNKLGTDITGTICKGSYNDLGFYQCKSIIVGGYTAGEENVLAGMVYSQKRGIHLIKNKFGGIMINGPLLSADPFVKIIEYDNGLIKGKANPGAKIQLYSQVCNTGCLSRSYWNTTFADASGNWNYPYLITMPNLVATATTGDSSTSEFSGPKVNHLNAIVKHATCGKSNGSITGIVVNEGTHIRWLDSYTLQLVSTDTNLVNVPAGSYVLTVSNGANGCLWNVNYTIYDQSLPTAISATVSNSSCGGSNGGIYTNAPSNLVLKWLNSNNDSIGMFSSVYNLLPGSYYLKANISGDTSCNKTYGPYTVSNQSGPSLNTSNFQITPATCGNSAGSITGITAANTTGTPFIRWVDSLNNAVGNSYDLNNVPPGKYRLKFKDASGCDTIITPFYVVGNNGNIIIDTNTILIRPAKCTGNTGSIQNITVTGGNNYQWKNTATGAIVGSTLNISNLPAGSYQLTVTNSFGCSKTLPVINVSQTSFIPIGITFMKTYLAFCGQPNGSIQPQTFTGDTAVYSFRWTDSTSSQTIGNYTQLFGIYGGTYRLYAKDSNGCEGLIRTITIISAPVPAFDHSAQQIVPDKCLSGQGAISGIMVNNLRNGAGKFVWLNSANDSIGNTLAIQGLSQGTYRLQVTDLMGCSITSQPIVVNNVNVPLAAPQCDGATILINTTGTLNVKNLQPGKYQWFNDPLGVILLQENTTGIFTSPALASDKTYYLRYVNGVCQSNIIAVKITVVDKTAVYVPTGFTPNGDGKNDLLRIVAYGKVRLHYFTVFNRWGEVVFSSTNLNNTWNGTVNGTPVPGGVYVWIVKAVDELSGQSISQKGTVMIIR